jgi:hypothetical protein
MMSGMQGPLPRSPTFLAGTVAGRRVPTVCPSCAGRGSR